MRYEAAEIAALAPKIRRADGGRRHISGVLSRFLHPLLPVCDRSSGGSTIHSTAVPDALLRGPGGAGLAVRLHLALFIGQEGREVYFQRHGGRAAAHAKRWVQNRAFWSVFIPAILPPPLPFKVFVLAEGVFQVPLKSFVSALLLGRGLRYFAEGILAVRYGEPALVYMVAHSGVFAIGAIVALAVLYAASHWFFRRPSEES